MDFFELDEYTKKDIDDLIQNEVEESTYLDYKDGRALDPDKIVEITKDISAFANADGGIIVYGVSENKVTHKPENYAPVTNPKITKEWLEQKICLVRRKINGVLIFPIRVEGNADGSIYIVKIPRSNNAPHMALDNKYYKRHNFSSDPMEEYEVRESFFREYYPKLEIVNCDLQDEECKEGDKTVTFSFKAWIRNSSTVISKDYKLSASFFNLPKETTCHFQPHEGKLLSMYICSYCMRLSSPSKEPIFPNELIETGHYQFTVPIDSVCDILDKTYIKLTLPYEGGGKDEMLKLLADESTSLFEKEEIDDYIKRDHPDFNLLDII